MFHLSDRLQSYNIYYPPKKMSLLTGIKRGKKKKRKDPPPAVKKSEDSNLSVAEQLKASLAAGQAPPVDPLQRRITQEPVISQGNDPVLLMPAASKPKDEANLTIQELVALERQQTMSTNEQDARNMFRTGKKRKLKAGGRNIDSDDDEQLQLQLMTAHSKKAGRTEQRERSRQIATHDRQAKIATKCWWWLESTQFAKHRLLALGNFVSLVMAPANLSLTPGEHFYLVPIPHVESLAACEDEVWDEIVRFQSSLRALYESQDKGVLFCETVLPQSGFWQTKLECIPCPKNVVQDAPLYFKTSLSEQADDWGTHQKLLHTGPKGLRRTVPNNFAYFYLEYEQAGGYAQLIESSNFPRDFGNDTIAGMMEMDPLRFRRKEAHQGEKESILKFLEKWKKFDWTLDLDG